LNDLEKVEFASASGSEPSDNQPAPSVEVRQTTLLWFVLGLGAVAVALGLAYPVWRPRFRGETVASRGDLTLQRQRLLFTLVRLDQAYEAGQLNETVYRRARARRKADLAEVLRRMQNKEL
jgi:hypothetical protein